MDDMMAKIQAMLSDEESMNQIKQLANMLTSAANEEGSENGGGGTENQNQSPPPDFSKLFGAMSGGGQGGGGNQDGGFGFDIGTIMQLQGLMQAVSSNDKNAELLLALKPHLKEEKHAKVDKAVKLLKLFALWTVVKESGLLNSIDLF